MKMKTISEIRHTNLLELITRFKGVTKFAEVVDRSYSQISQIKNRTRHSKTGAPREVGDDLARHIERMCQLEAGWMDRDHPQAEGNSPTEVLYGITVPEEVTELEWETLMTVNSLPPKFQLRMPDDSMAPSVQKGTSLIFESTNVPAPGQGVLIKTSSGLYIRRYQQGPGARWMGVAANSAYAPIDSERDAAEIAAVVTWIGSGMM